MKLIIAALLASYTFTTGAQAAPLKDSDPKACEQLRNEIDDNCAHIVCDDLIKKGDFKDLGECTSGADYGEYSQGICDDEPNLGQLVRQYNEAHKHARLACEE